MGILSRQKSDRDKATGRNYAREDKWENSPVQVKRREQRNAARRKLMRKGIVKKGDGKDVDHKDANPMNNSDDNLHGILASKNRSFPRDKKARKKPGRRYGKRIVVKNTY